MRQESALEIPFALEYNGQPISCTESTRATLLTDLRFYVSDLTLLGSDGREFPLTLVADEFWQTESVALLDFENGEGACINGTARMNHTITGTHSAGDVTGLSFTLGVPEHLNHADPLSAAAPLSFTDMHWHWASGYKFLRAGVQTENDGFWLHLGSNRCAGVLGNIEACGASNRPRVTLQAFVPETDGVVLDLGILFADIDFTDAIASDCSSGPAETTCAIPFAALGLRTVSGESVQSVAAFAARKMP